MHKRVNSFIACSAFCPGPPNREPTDSEKRLRVPRWHGMHGVLTRLPSKIFKNRNARLDALRCELVNAIITFHIK